MKFLPGYFLEANVYLLLFLAFYRICLWKETQFRLNRTYLLVALAVSMVFPLVPLDAGSGPAFLLSVSNTVQTNWLPQVVVTTGEKTASSWSWLTKTGFGGAIQGVYLAGLVVYLLFFIFQLLQLLRLIRKAKVYRWNNCLVADSREATQTFSFFNFIFIGNTWLLTPGEKQKILRHERVHVSQWHSVDILLSNMVGIIFWFNPFVRSYQRLLVQLHEFEADAHVVGQQDVNDYCQLLTRVALQSAGFPLANHFNNSLTLKRISMMQTIKKKMPGWKIAGLIVLFPAAFLLVSCQKQAVDDTTKTNQNARLDSESGNQDKGQVYTLVETMPVFPGGINGFVHFITSHMRYPAESRQKGTEGTVLVSFQVDEQGAVTHPEVVQGLDEACNQEAIRVISQVPTWTPGMQNGAPAKVKYLIPIKFVRSTDGKASITLDQIQLDNSEMATSLKRVEKDSKVNLDGAILTKEGKPLSGASIIVKGTTTGTMTDKNGNYSLRYDQLSGELVVSYVGYETKSIPF